MREVLTHVRSNVVAYVALFAALGGTAYAGSEISGGDVRNNSLTGKDVRNGSLTGADEKDGSLKGADIADGSIGGADVANGAIGAAQLANGAVGSAQVADGAIGSAQLADGYVGKGDLAIPTGVVGGRAKGLTTAMSNETRSPFGVSSSLADNNAVAPVNIELKNLHMVASPAPGAGQSVAIKFITLNLATGTPTVTNLGCTVQGAGSGPVLAAQCDTGNATLSVSAGDIYSIAFDSSAGSATTSAIFGYTVTPN
jgi:hypothetical protein